MEKKKPTEDGRNSSTVVGIQELQYSKRMAVEELLVPFTAAVHYIDVQGHPPIKPNMRRYSPKMLEIAHQKVNKYIEKGSIEPSNSPWCSPPVIVTRANGEPWFCIGSSR